MMELFDDDDDEVTTTTTTRPAENGVLQFHQGTEDALLLHVRKNHNTTKDNVLSTIDEFCETRHWMMHCGPKKGRLMEEFLLERLSSSSTKHHVCIVELGTYCGYSAIRMAQCLEKKHHSSYTIYSIDVHEKYLQLAQEMAQMAGVAHGIEFLLRTNERKNLDSLLRSSCVDNNKIDFLLLDHAKDLYLQDLQHLEQTGWLQAGSAVVADNVVFAEIAEYRQYVQTNDSMTTRTVVSSLEYSDIPDGIELSVYVKDPPRDGEETSE